MDTKINTFIFDCFGVICDPPLSNWYKNKSEKHGFIDEKLHDILREFDLGKMSEEDMEEYFSKYEGINLTREAIRDEIDAYLQLDRTLADMIGKLKNTGFKTILLSNANASFFERKIYKLYPEFKNLFDEIVISSEVGMVKPDKEIYLHTLEKISSKPEECVFIDDNKENVLASEKLGITGYVYTDSKSFAEYLKTLGINL